MIAGHARTIAFPGAEGAGKYTKGGRGGTVYQVTNLNDSGPGSLREAIKASGPRMVVFRVSGTIELESDLKIKSPYITIAGQSAPGDGICLKNHSLYVQHDEVIIRYLRFRLGDESGAESDAIWGRYGKNVIIDHCSASWSVDEAMSFYSIDSLTIQWCLIAESLYMSHHSKGAHGYGGIWGGENATFHHNLFAHHSSRNPRFSGGSTAPCQNVDFINNVIYNWGFNSVYGGEDGKINMVANYYKPGPATKSNVRNRICEPSDLDGRWYIEDNTVEGAPQISKDNWAGGVQGGRAVESVIRVNTPFPNEPLPLQSAEEACLDVVDDVGANYPVRDRIDDRIIHDVTTGTATYDGLYYEIIQGFSDTSVVRGIIDSQSDVNGWPALNSLPAPVDSDHDGMPDEWERSNQLDPNDETDRNLIGNDGYTMLEIYLNSLVPGNTSGVKAKPDLPRDYVVLRNYPNPFNPSTRIVFQNPGSEWINLSIYDLQGRLVKSLYEGKSLSAYREIEWDGRNDFGNRVSSGIYFAVMRSGLESTVLKMQLIR
jgi:pectate lyase